MRRKTFQQILQATLSFNLELRECFLFAAIFFCCLNFISCDSFEDSIISEKDYFPIKAGSHWKYLVTDSLTLKDEVVSVNIIGTNRLHLGELFSKWEYKSKSFTDTDFVVIRLDSVMFYDDASLTKLKCKFIIPFEVGKGWRGKYFHFTDTTFVSEESPVRFKNFSFRNAFKIKRQYGALNDYGRVENWFVPQVGIVSEHHYKFGFWFENKYWELIEYKIL